MARRAPLIVGLDVGTYKVGAIVAELTAQGTEIVGIGSSTSKGLRKGVVVNIEATVEAIRKATEEAELMAGCEIRSVIVGSAGNHIKGFNSHGVVAVKGREVGPGDVERVLDAARAIALPMDRQVLHVLPQEFIVDDQDGIKEPIGMAGVRLEARVHIVTGAISSGQNLIKCCNRAGLHVRDVLAGPLAAAEAVLTPEERELGVALLDLGGGTTDVVVVHAGAIRHTAVLPVGGGHVTTDLAAALRTPFAEAERLKQREVIEPRMEELFTFVRRELERAGCAHVLTSGIVLTGGGAAMQQVMALAERVFRPPVRLGVPLHLSGLVDVVASPMYSTAVGLVLHGLKQDPRMRHGDGMRGQLGAVGERMMGWLREFF
ncbi:MAG: cell division protein FtsA [Deltaproteobacteria bacterium]|nr:MAG: cell division protein FtsA [Deltaproteobacteria bacterium]